MPPDSQAAAPLAPLTVPVHAAPGWRGTLRTIKAYVVKAVDLRQIALSITCLIFLAVILFLITEILSLLLNLDYWSAGKPSSTMKIVLDVIPGFKDNFTKFSAFILPFFALLAGLQSRSGVQSLFFTIFVCICVLGAVMSLGADWFVTSRVGTGLFTRVKWVGEEEFTLWKVQAGDYFNLSFQTFITFVSVLLGLKAAEK
jgi:fluoride ion exporter CrcB/FEX